MYGLFRRSGESRYSLQVVVRLHRIRDKRKLWLTRIWKRDIHVVDKTHGIMPPFCVTTLSTSLISARKKKGKKKERVIVHLKVSVLLGGFSVAQGAKGAVPLKHTLLRHQAHKRQDENQARNTRRLNDFPDMDSLDAASVPRGFPSIVRGQGILPGGWGRPSIPHDAR